MPRILVIDDSKVQRTFARLILEDAGHDVVESADGTQGLELVRQESPDCVLLDLLMPGLSGVEVLRVLRQEGHAIPVIVVTAQECHEGRAECLAEGAAAVVDKACRPDELTQAVRSALAGNAGMQRD